MTNINPIEYINVFLKQIELGTKRKKFVRRFIELVENYINSGVITEEDIINTTDNELVNIIKKIRNIEKHEYESDISYTLLEKMTYEQCAYYKLCANHNKDILETYFHYHINCREIFYNICNQFRNNPLIFKYTYELDFSKSLKSNIGDIKQYCHSLIIAAKFNYKVYEQGLAYLAPGTPVFITYHSDVIGNEDKWKQTIIEWTATRFAYKMHCEEGKTKVDTIRTLSKSKYAKIYCFNQEHSDMSNLIHKLDKYIDDAQQLIASAAKGSFPY